MLAEFAKYGERTSGTIQGSYEGGGRHGKYSQLGAPEKDYSANTGTAARFFKACKETDEETAARFYYTAKTSKTERDGATHPTIKPIALMRYLCRLVCPPGGTVLDPFAGSGSTLIAAYREGFHSIGIERDPDYFEMATERVSKATAQMRLAL